MKAVFIPLVFMVLVCIGCKQSVRNTRPEDYFTEGQEKSLRMQIVLKTAKKPEGSLTPPEIEAYYQQEAGSYQWHYLHEKYDRFYFFISRPAPAQFEKRIGIGGFFISPDRMHIRGFREIFNTYKMKRDDLLKKGGVLFDKMVNGQNLKPYHSAFNPSVGEWIEFPDRNVAYDSLSQSWKLNTATPIP